ncbi:MAG: aldo/keto reductase [Betaproteobacteria bacterium]|nr:aldo/keto reductase [Betaproteobacteria bacterium]
MRTIPLGGSGYKCSVLGLGCMGMSEFYGPRDDVVSMQTLERAFELGITFYDTSDMYGRGHNEELLGRFIRNKRDKVIISTKFGFKRDPNGADGSTHDRDLDNSPAYISQACDASLKRLGTDYIDIFSAHRYDTTRPIEEVAETVAGLVKAGKVRTIGFSEITGEQLRRASKVHSIAALQNEYSLWHRRPEEDVLPVCRELNVTLVAYSPLGRGFLTGAVQDAKQLAANDVRLTVERFKGDNLDKNLQLVNEVKAIASARDITPGQIALAWLFAQGDNIIPIPGTKRIKYLEENVGAVAVTLTQEELKLIGDIINPAKIAGTAETASQAAGRLAAMTGGSSAGADKLKRI